MARAVPRTPLETSRNVLALALDSLRLPVVECACKPPTTPEGQHGHREPGHYRACVSCREYGPIDPDTGECDACSPEQAKGNLVNKPQSLRDKLLQSLRDKLHDAESELEAAQEDVDDLESSLTDAENARDMAEAKVEELETQIEELEQPADEEGE